jgi:uncharacterized membrane protein
MSPFDRDPLLKIILPFLGCCLLLMGALLLMMSQDTKITLSSKSWYCAEYRVVEEQTLVMAGSAPIFVPMKTRRCVNWRIR